MEISKERMLTFLIGCLGTRSLLAYIAYYAEDNNIDSLQILLGVLAIFIGIGFITIWLFGNELANDQLKVWKDKDDKLWWNNFRIVHGIIYILFGIFSLMEIQGAYKLLIIDLILGLLLWIMHHIKMI